MSTSFYGPVHKISLELRLKRIIISFKLQDATLSHKLQAFGHRQITYWLKKILHTTGSFWAVTLEKKRVKKPH